MKLKRFVSLSSVITSFFLAFSVSSNTSGDGSTNPMNAFVASNQTILSNLPLTVTSTVTHDMPAGGKCFVRLVVKN